MLLSLSLAFSPDIAPTDRMAEYQADRHTNQEEKDRFEIHQLDS
ncbi:MAG TPA: hypothetical protein VFE22_04810 [Edaphobacter sp.]|nr:hypothetical protein [Edaphobacter sp.]